MSASAGIPRIGVVGKIYFIQSGDRPLVKIGWTIELDARLRQLQCGNPDTLKLLGTVPGTVDDERAWHRRFQHLCVRNEWFNLDADLLAAIAARRNVAKELIEQRYSGAPLERDEAVKLILSLREEHSRSMMRERGRKTGLTDEKVADILRDGRSVRAIARDYGVGAMTIQNIRSRKTWRHVCI